MLCPLLCPKVHEAEVERYFKSPGKILPTTVRPRLYKLLAHIFTMNQLQVLQDGLGSLANDPVEVSTLPPLSAYPILSCPLEKWNLQLLSVQSWSLGTQVMSENYRISLLGEGLQLGPLFWLDENRQSRSKSIKTEIQILSYLLHFIPAPICFL